jgi:hypothetical protein
MVDLTIIYITANKMPAAWMDYQTSMLLLVASKGVPIISISREPMRLGTNFVEHEPHGYWNIYRQLCYGARQATTQYIAMCEDDTLYPLQHFTEYAPQENAFSYNRARWSLFAWEKRPVYCLRERVSNCTLIAPRDLVIAAIQERLDKYPDGDTMPQTFVGEIGRRRVEKGLKVTRRKSHEWCSTVPVVQLNHPHGIDARQKAQHKKHAKVKAYDIPYWGKAADIVAKYNATT